MNENEVELQRRVDALSQEVRKLRHIVVGTLILIGAFALPVLSMITPGETFLVATIFGLFALGLYPIIVAIWNRVGRAKT